jgi:hypothetical protein
MRPHVPSTLYSTEGEMGTLRVITTLQHMMGLQTADIEDDHFTIVMKTICNFTMRK